ncbi:Hypothetical protein CINCED_3A015568 [Cinara cedri]|uniref:Uncharacterized protein n=1 Tax=Cinara cedri TaxID=506608 RepID=A0A5E4LYH1_9HEMI|nr:Hypothetical protein CINCED_3A015568 [Cinara cedri]
MEFLELIHCYKCKKKTKNFKPIKVQTTNGLWRISTQCLKYKTKKSKFIKTLLGKETISKIKFEKITERDKLSIAKKLHKPVRSQFLKRKIKTYGIDDYWPADLVIMINYGNENLGFEEIIKKAEKQKHNSPTLLHIDIGTEFVNKQFKEMLAK